MFLIVFVQARGLWHLCRYIWERFRLPQHHHWKRWGPSQIHDRSISHECCMMLNDCLLQAAFADLIRAQLEKHQQVVLSPAILMLEALPLWNFASKARFIAEGYREALEIPDFHRFPLNLIREGGKWTLQVRHMYPHLRLDSFLDRRFDASCRCVIIALAWVISMTPWYLRTAVPGNCLVCF